MRIRFTRGTALGGVGNDAQPGDERDLPDLRAIPLVNQGRAVIVEAAAPAKAAEQESPAATPTKRRNHK